tara:strand:+ start:289 stop:537 length:249 start_codon:yes stop_codon:yes gene_type:complete
MTIIKPFIKKTKKILLNQSGSLLRTIIYTIGHFFIAAACVMYFTGANLYVGMTDALVEPILNGIWYYILDRFWISKKLPLSN